MQINIKTKRGTVELSLRKLRVFHRLNRLEERMQAAEEQIKRLRAFAEACPYQNRAEEPAELRTPKRDDSAAGQDSAMDIFTEWTEGEEVATQRRNERMQEAEERARKEGEVT